MAFAWEPNSFGGFSAKMPNNVTLVVTPDRLARGFTPKPARGTGWHAQCSHWDEATRCMSRFGRCEYGNLQKTAKDAMRLAEEIYSAAL
jgi:hypothetical protein